MSGDWVEHLLVEILPASFVAVTLDGDQRLKRFQNLDGSFEADCVWLSEMAIVLSSVGYDVQIFEEFVRRRRNRAVGLASAMGV